MSVVEALAWMAICAMVIPTLTVVLTLLPAICRARRRNRTKTDHETATAPAGSATDGAGDTAKPLK